jgi:predicted RNase H-like nuclease
VRTVLAIDAAWTKTNPSGIALVQKSKDGWKCIAVAPSYAQFFACARGAPDDWTQKLQVGPVTSRALLDAAAKLAGGVMPDVVTIDMPIATVPITGRRAADRAVSAAFGAYGCATHSPSAAMPGLVGRALSRGFVSAGYPIATVTTGAIVPALVEVYPHPALLSLVNASYRVPYKAGKVRDYWPDLTATDRRQELMKTWGAIRRMLRKTIGDIDGRVPTGSQIASVPSAYLKRYEDALDALVCAWVGIRYLDGDCRSYGDKTAAIWTPAVLRKAKRLTV